MAQSINYLERVIEEFEKKWPQHLESLKQLVRIPSVSFTGFPREEVNRSARAVADLLKASGLENIQLLSVKDCSPYVYGEYLKNPDAPTLLLYAHHDVQPPGQMQKWKTPPFEPTEKQGPGGLRLFGRGAADDKAGIIVHTASISSFMSTLGELPVNVKVVIEGEEEIGSTHLVDFLQEYRTLLEADIIILTDTLNFDTGVPSLTVSLRGMVALEVEVRALRNTVHSGMWGGPVPDPAMALCKVLSKLTDSNGQIAVPAILAEIQPLSASEEKMYAHLPYDETRFREQSGMITSAQILNPQISPFVQIWRHPSLTVNALQSSSREQAGNTINDTAWARITVRLAPGMNPEKVRDALQDEIQKHVPWGLELSIKEDACAPAWSTETSHPVFETALRALEKGYGAHPVFVGCGGSIPFVRPFSEALDGAPALLVGVEDPFTNAHGENESLLIDDLRKACLSQIYLFWELRAKGLKGKDH